MSFAVVSSLYPHPINRTREEHHDRYLHLRRLFQPRRLRLPQRQLGRLLGQARPELLDHRLAMYDVEQRMVFGANTYRQFVQMLASSTEESAVRDAWVTRMTSMPATVVSTTLDGPLNWPDATVVRGDAVDVVAQGGITTPGLCRRPDENGNAAPRVGRRLGKVDDPYRRRCGCAFFGLAGRANPPGSSNDGFLPGCAPARNHPGAAGCDVVSAGRRPRRKRLRSHRTR
jgi:hypothetical protein